MSLSIISLEELLYTAQRATGVLDTVLTHLRPYHSYIFSTAVVCTAILALLRLRHRARQQLRTTQLRGPPSESFLYGVGKRIIDAEDPGAVYESWAQEHGLAYAIPSTVGNQRIVLCDPKAVAHFCAKDSWTYIQTPFTRKLLADLVGKGVLWSHGESHKRQRKSLTPAFSISAIRQVTSVFFDSAYKAKAAWDALIESSKDNNTLIEVQNWMNHISLDTIGLAGFSHNFAALEGKHSSVTELFDSFSGSSRFNKGLFLLAEAFPFVLRIPTSRARQIQKLHIAMEEISTVLLARTQKELEMGVVDGKEERSIIGLLIKGANGSSGFHLTKDEVMAQMRVLLVAGYETTSISLTWALLELSRNPEVQMKLRNELLEHGEDPTYDQLANGLPYLDAVVHETLRVHPPITEFTRVATEDDVIPVSGPIRTKSGSLVDCFTIAKGTLVVVSIQAMNRSAAIWGEDAKVFRPSRWLEGTHGPDGIPAKAKEIQGYRHLLTFIDGPRTCLGKNFAVAEFKAVLTVLVKNFVFEMRDGVDSKIETEISVLPRPKIAGEAGCKVPLRVRPYAA